MRMLLFSGIFIVTFIFIFVGVNVAENIAHEKAHEEIGRGHGCINSTIDYNFFGVSTYLCNEYEERSDAVKMQENLLHSQNEIQGYTISRLANSLLIASFLMYMAVQFFGIIIYKKLEEAVESGK